MKKLIENPIFALGAFTLTATAMTCIAMLALAVYGE
jgi:hypothetical protein